MVRLRSQSGVTTVVDRFEAIEILDSDGRLGVVVITTAGDTVRILMPGDPLFTGYCRTHGVAPAKVHRHEVDAVLPPFAR